MNPSNQLPRVLGYTTATAIVVGTVIGSGVFKKATPVATNVPEFGLAMLAWVLVGFLTILGALALAEVAVIVGKVEALKGARGFNAGSGEFEDLVAAGIIDPTKVVRTALQNAASIAGLLLTTDVAVTDAPEPKKPAPPMPGGGEDYDY